MTQIESKIKTLNISDKEVFEFITDLNNLQNVADNDKIKNWKSDEASCSFTVDGVGEVGIKIIEKEPYKTVKFAGDETLPVSFFFWIQLKQVAEDDTKMKLTIKAELNPMMKMVAKKPLTDGIDLIANRIADYFNNGYKRNRE